MSVVVTTTDTETGDTETMEVPRGGYVLVCGEGRELDGIQAYGNGTIILTTKRVRPTASVAPEEGG